LQIFSPEVTLIRDQGWINGWCKRPLKSWYSQFPCLMLSIKEIVWTASWQVRLLCPWAGT